MKEKYYIVKNKALATTLGYILNRKYYTYDSREDASKKVYSFLWDDKFNEALDLVMKLREENL